MVDTIWLNDKDNIGIYFLKTSQTSSFMSRWRTKHGNNWRGVKRWI